MIAESAALALVTGVIDMWIKIRETIDPEVRKRWDMLVLNDYLWVREKLGIPAQTALGQATSSVTTSNSSTITPVSTPASGNEVHIG